MKALLFLLVLFCATNMFAQRSPVKHLPAYMTAKEQEAAKMRGMQALSLQQPSVATALPTEFRIPGEWEESQAVLVEWPYDSDDYDPSASLMLHDEQGYGNLWMQLVDAIQQECPAWIIIWKGEDSTTIKQFMAEQGRPLVRYRFFIPSQGGNAFWTRDFGPIGFYYGDKDSIGFIDLQYYPGRDRDNLTPAYLAEQLGYLSFPTELHSEGGNFMADGYGHDYFSTRVAGDQLMYYGWSRKKTLDSLQYAYKFGQSTELPELVCDGGTGHIDMYIKLLDEETIVSSRYPSVVTAVDRATIDKNISLCKSLTAATGRPYKVYEFPMPTRDDGQYSTTCDQINKDARGYINGVFVNKTYIFPTYSDAFSGNAAADLEAVKLYQQMLPGYKIVPIDSRILSVGGGAIHCVTMQIPAENPIRFLHQSITGLQPLKESYPLTAMITNRDGIRTAVCHWRKKGASEWNTEELALGGATPYDFGGGITNMGFANGDVIEYYLEAESNNGKKMTKPITAPQGYYSFIIDNESDVPQEGGALTTRLLEVYPNPVQEECILPFMLGNGGQVILRVTDITGREEAVMTGAMSSGFNSFRLATTTLAQGVHFYSLYVNGKFVQTSRFVVVK